MLPVLTWAERLTARSNTNRKVNDLRNFSSLFLLINNYNKKAQLLPRDELIIPPLPKIQKSYLHYHLLFSKIVLSKN
ncbi:MAG: hypothetical protein B5M54_04780 [Candidatus Aminicenantes bacterium 4484_214]|nr:MAG: hypothetical protein B5M54_04780 [Candidatus Aminicenantes bacterium 4484_214]